VYRVNEGTNTYKKYQGRDVWLRRDLTPPVIKVRSHAPHNTTHDPVVFQSQTYISTALTTARLLSIFTRANLQW
jgi:hypothetical protein